MDNINKLNEIESIKLAKTTKDERILAKLLSSPFTTVRRSIAKNRNANVHIINKLAMDPSNNVSYWATRHPNYNNKRLIHSNEPCVLCTIDELQYINTCHTCQLA